MLIIKLINFLEWLQMNLLGKHLTTTALWIPLMGLMWTARFLSLSKALIFHRKVTVFSKLAWQPRVSNMASINTIRMSLKIFKLKLLLKFLIHKLKTICSSSGLCLLNNKLNIFPVTTNNLSTMGLKVQTWSAIRRKITALLPYLLNYSNLN